MSSSDNLPRENSSERAGLVRQVLDECLGRQSRGEDLSDDQIISSHADLMPELGVELRKLRLIQRARRQAAETEVTREPPDASRPPPSRFEGYEIVREIHHGGQGVVYEAIQKSTRRKVAIKVLHGGPFIDSRGRARLQREIQILGDLEHPGIVGIHDSDEADGCPFYVMDYISGESLDAFLREHELSVDDTLRLFAKICDAVNAAHLRGVIHRDLKPSNIRVDRSGEPHVLDFGLARVAAHSVTEEAGPQLLSMTGQFIGSLPWASPEQAEGAPGKIDVRTDVYSLGVILYQMLTGGFPYEVVGNMRDVLDRILKAEPQRPSTVRRQVNDEIDTIVLRCLAKDRERRYQAAGELGRDIRHYLAGEPIDAKRDSVAYLLAKQLRRYRVPAAVAAAFLLLIIVGLVTSLTFWQRAAFERDRADEQRDHALAARDEADRQRDLAQANAARAELVADFLDGILANVDPAVAVGDRTSPLYVALVEVLHAADRRLDELSGQPEAEARVRNTLGRLYTTLGLYQEAKSHLRRAAEIRQEIFGTEHPATAESLNGLGVVLVELGEFDVALDCYQHALEARTAVYGYESLPVAETLAGLGELHYQRGEFEQAEHDLTQALELRRTLDAPAARQSASMAELGSTLRNLGRLDEAEELLREALRTNREFLGHKDTQTLVSLNLLALLLKQKGKLAESRDLFAQTLDLRREVLGDQHPHVAVSHYNLARVLTGLEDDDSAVPHFQAALRIWRTCQPPEHNEIRVAVLNLGGAFVRLRRYADAEQLMLHRYEELNNAVGPDHPLTTETANYIADLYTRWGKPAEAERWRRELPDATAGPNGSE